MADNSGATNPEMGDRILRYDPSYIQEGIYEKTHEVFSNFPFSEFSNQENETKEEEWYRERKVL